jgi:hypothetical protein
MPITQIARIQHRRGVSDDLPTLASAELGWVLDQKRLYIGNGTIEEGAPNLGNTEILTEFSDVLGLASTYTFTGEAAGFTATTGSTGSNPVLRSLQSKLDDSINVRDFGAIGDGLTDDTAAVNRALYQVYARYNNTTVRRTLYFPAGVYLVSDVVKIPSYARIQGDGIDATIIKQTSSSVDCVVKLADSKQQVDGNIGNNGATRPQYISVQDITFWNITDKPVLLITSAQNSVFTRVKLQGSFSVANSVGTSNPCLKIASTPSLISNNIIFDKCEFSDQTYACIGDDDQFNIVFANCKLTNLYRGFKIGEYTTGAGSALVGPQGLKIVNCLFNSVYKEGILGYSVKKISSMGNYFRDVGNHFNGTGSPQTNVIVFAADDCVSIGDTFDRTDADASTLPRLSGAAYGIYSLIANVGVQHGSTITTPGRQQTLADNTSSATATTITVDINTSNTAQIYYRITRNTTYRTGIMKLVHNASAQILDDDYTETATACGVTFATSYSSNVTTITYTTTSTGYPASLRYDIKYSL